MKASKNIHLLYILTLLQDWNIVIFKKNYDFNV